MAAASFTITVSPPTSMTRAIELMWAQRGVALAMENARGAGGQTTSGTISADGVSALASWTYTPGASS